MPRLANMQASRESMVILPLYRFHKAYRNISALFQGLQVNREEVWV